MTRQDAAIDYAELPGMPDSNIVGHRGRLLLGQSGAAAVFVLQGRVHSYEGYDPEALTFAVRLLCELGVQYLILTNAAGGIQTGLAPGNLMLIEDHLEFPRSLARSTPGWPAPGGACPWDQRLIALAESTPTSLTVRRGTYAMMSGPNYETPAEVRALGDLGADAVGMSTVPEARCAAAAGVRVLGVSCITNFAAGISPQPLNHAEVSQTAGRVERAFADWLSRIIAELGCVS